MDGLKEFGSDPSSLSDKHFSVCTTMVAYAHKVKKYDSLNVPRLNLFSKNNK